MLHIKAWDINMHIRPSFCPSTKRIIYDHKNRPHCVLYYLRPAFSFVYVKGKSHHFDVWIMCLFHDLVLHCFLFHSVGQGAIIKIIIPTHDKLMEIEHLK